MLKKFICDVDCEAFLNKFLNAMKDGFMLSQLIRNTDGDILDYRILEINDSFEKLFIVSRNTLLGKSFSDFFPDDFLLWLNTVFRHATDWTSQHTSIYFREIDKHFRVNLIKQLNDMYIILFNDITELVRVQEQLKNYFILFENAKDIILFIKSDASIFDANKTAVEQYGYSKEELLDLKIYNLIPPDTLKDFQEQMVLSSENGIVFETIHIKKNGTYFPVEVSSKPIEINGELIQMHIIRDISDRKKVEEKIKYFADYDALTGIYNRGFLMYQFRKTLKNAAESNLRFAVLLFDIDKFKFINDTYGHNAGDEVIKEVAKRLSKAVRKTDIIGRLGGDEFLVVQPIIRDSTDPFILSKRILDMVARPLVWENITFDIRISIGISIYPDSSDNIKGLMKRADSAMYYVKQHGGNSYNY